MLTERPDPSGSIHDRPVCRVVRFNGELDVAVRDDCFSACTAGNAVDVTVDLADVTFMDCNAYGTLLVARSLLRQRQGSLAILNARGQPERLIGLIAELETARSPR